MKAIVGFHEINHELENETWVGVHYGTRLYSYEPARDIFLLNRKLIELNSCRSHRKLLFYKSGNGTKSHNVDNYDPR